VKAGDCGKSAGGLRQSKLPKVTWKSRSEDGAPQTQSISLMRPERSWGSGGFPQFAIIGPYPFNQQGQTAVALEDSIGMSSFDIEHQLSA
jgi:hypothetical protein